MENKIIKYEGGVVKRVGVAIEITNKLIKNSQKLWLQLYNPEQNQYDYAAKEELIDFIKVNFWYFLSAIIQKERRKEYHPNNEISKETIQKIRSTKYQYEFPRCSYKSKIAGEEFDRLKDTMPYEISMKLDDDLKQEILRLVCPTVAGKILSYFADTSIAHILFSVQEQDIMPMSLYFEAANGLALPILKANTSLPVQAKQSFTTSKDWVKTINVHLLQGFSDIANENKSLMRFSIENIPAAPKGEPQIQVIFEIDTNGILHLTPQDKSLKIIIDKTFDGLSKEQIKQLQEKSIIKSVKTKRI